MQSFRSALLRRPGVAALVLLAALLLRLAVPAGYMPVLGPRGPVLTPCSGIASRAHAAMAMPGMAHHEAGGDGVQAGGGCAFADLALPAIGGADPILLTAAIRHILVVALHPVPASPRHVTPRLRPPLRGPPPPG